jgi:peptide/nickel transport system substrate-binding protein
MSESTYWDGFLRRRLSRRAVVRAGAFAGGAAALLAAGCSSGGGSTPATAESSGPAPTPAPGLTPQSTPAGQSIKRGGQMATGVFNAPIPHFEVAGASRLFMIAECLGGNWNQLVRYRAQSFNDNTIVPDLADSWNISPDGKTYTFKLNPQAKWHNVPPTNGRDFTSADVKWNYEYLTNPNVKSFLAPLFSNIEEVETPDPKTVVFRLKTTQANFLDVWAGGGGGFVKMQAREIFEQDGNFQKRIVGTGPFMLDKHDQGVSVTMKRNPDYWRMGADGKPLPYLDSYIVYVYRDLNAATAQLVSGQFNVSAPGGARQEDWPQFEKAGIRLVQTSGPTHNFVRLNLSRPPFDKLEVRRALALSLDQSDLLQTLRVDGVGTILGYIPPFFGDYALTADQVKAKLKYDLNQAKQLAQSSGLSGQKFKITGYLKATIYETGPQYLQQHWKDIGVDLDLDWPPDTTAFTRLQTSGDFQMLFVPEGFNGDLDNWVYGLWHSKSPTNFSKLNDPKVDKFAEDQRAELDANKRKQIVHDFENYMLDQAYAIPIPLNVQKDGYAPYVRNFSRHWAFGYPGLEVAWFDK